MPSTPYSYSYSAGITIMWYHLTLSGIWYCDSGQLKQWIWKCLALFLFNLNLKPGNSLRRPPHFMNCKFLNHRDYVFLICEFPQHLIYCSWEIKLLEAIFDKKCLELPSLGIVQSDSRAPELQLQLEVTFSASFSHAKEGSEDSDQILRWSL